MKRVESNIKPQISVEKCESCWEKGTKNTICISRTLLERAMEIKKQISTYAA